MTKKNEFGEQSAGPAWTMADFHNNWCLYEQVGTPKVLDPPTQEDTVHPPMAEIPDEGITEMLRKAYYSIGGDKTLADWARKNPTEFYKIMLRVPAKENVSNVPMITINLGGSLGRLVEERRLILEND